MKVCFALILNYFTLAVSLVQAQGLSNIQTSPVKNPCCVCVHSDRSKDAPEFINGCSNPELSPRSWLESQGCKDVELIPLSKLENLNKKKCDSLVIAYAGHSTELRLKNLLHACHRYRPLNCEGGLCVKYDACGTPEDIINLREKDHPLLLKMLKNFGRLTVIANQTEVCGSGEGDNTSETIDFNLRKDDSVESHETFLNCHQEGTLCIADDGRLLNFNKHIFEGLSRHYRNYWRCLDSSGEIKTQYCCRPSSESNTIWKGPGQKCDHQ